MRGLALLLLALWGCGGGKMLNVGDRAPEFPQGTRSLDGRGVTVEGLTDDGPLVLILLRGLE